MTDYALLEKQLLSLFETESDFLANSSQFSAFMFNALANLNWAGFYFVRGGELVLGPFQGQVACVHIPMGRGVCGTAAAEKTVQRVADVDAFPGHIACDSASRSELVIPVIVEQHVLGVFDMDSPSLDRFSAEDEVHLKRLVNIYVERTNFVPAQAFLTP